MLEVLRNHITQRLGENTPNPDNVLSAFKHISAKRKTAPIRYDASMVRGWHTVLTKKTSVSWFLDI